MKAWHFVQNDYQLRWGDHPKVCEGQELSVDPKKLQLCEYGLHASEKIIDALKYAPGSIVCRVELSGKILKDTNKFCAEKRKVLWLVDADNLLHEFACDTAETLLKKYDITDERCLNAVRVKRDWLAGKATDTKLINVQAAARDAASDAARAAAWDAAWAAARAGACNAAWAAAWAGAWNAAWAAAWAAASDAASDAARAAARDAAWNAAWDEKNKDLEMRVRSLRI